MAQVLQAHAGNTAEWQLAITNSDGTAKNLTGSTGLTFLVKERIDDVDASAIITATPTVSDAVAGLITVALVPADTASVDAGTYVWGVQFVDSGSKRWEFPDPTQDPGKFILKSGVVAASS